MLEILLTVVLAGHLFCVNVGSAGPLACIWLHRQESRYDNVTAGYIGRQLAPLSVTLLSLGVMLGLALIGLLWLQDDRAYFRALAQFPLSRYWFSLAELVFSFALMAAYMLLWDRLRAHPNWHALLAVLAASNLLYHFPPLLTMISVISTRTELEGVAIDSAMYRSLLLDGEILSRVVHVWLASFAVTGMVIVAYAARISRLEDYREDAIMVAAWGARLALLPTLLQMVVGIWVTLTLSENARFAVMGEDAWASGMLVVSILAALALTHYLAALAMGELSRHTVRRSMALLAVVLILMSGTVRRARTVAARPAALTPPPAFAPFGAADEPALPFTPAEDAFDDARDDSVDRTGDEQSGDDFDQPGL